MKSIIYLPGIGGKNHNDSAHEYAKRYLYAMDRAGSDKSKKYNLEEDQLYFGLADFFKAPVTSIFEHGLEDDDEGVEVCRIYECSYDEDLTKKFEKKNVFRKLILVLIILFSKTWVLLKVIFKRNSLSGKKKLEIVYFLAFMFLIAAFALILFPTAVTSLTDIFTKTLPSDSALSKEIAEKIAPWTKYTHWIIAGLTLFTAIIPKFKKNISKKATDFLCIDSYLTMGNSKLELMGKVESLVEKILEEDNCDSLEIHSYGFGGIVLIDCLFPYGNKSNYRLSNEVKQIVTIRCPYHIISTYYPNYFKKRNIQKNMALERWFNIFSETDILSSNFETAINKDKDFLKMSEMELPIKNLSYEIINTEKLGFWKYLRLLSFKTHQTYWGESTMTSNCLYLIMEKTLEEEPS
nr:hypothetical protein [Allomuricauda sp.]